MHTVNLLQAASSLSSLVDEIEKGEETEIFITRNGRPAAKLVALTEQSAAKKIGVARGEFVIPDDIQSSDAEVARFFLKST